MLRPDPHPAFVKNRHLGSRTGVEHLHRRPNLLGQGLHDADAETCFSGCRASWHTVPIPAVRNGLAHFSFDLEGDARSIHRHGWAVAADRDFG